MEDKNLTLILEALAKLSKQVSNLEPKQQRHNPEPHESVDVKELYTALAKAQGEFGIAGLNKVNPYFKSNYADLTEMVKVSRPALSKHGLSVVQKVIHDEAGAQILLTKLGHSSGQWTISRVRLVPPKADIQSYGSYKTYQKRYEYGSLIGVVCADEDDDGEAAVHEYRNQANKGTGLNHKYNPKQESYETITKEQLDEIRYELGSHTDLAEEILEKMRIQTLSDLPKSKFMSAIKRIREIIQKRDGR